MLDGQSCYVIERVNRGAGGHRAVGAIFYGSNATRRFGLDEHREPGKPVPFRRFVMKIRMFPWIAIVALAIPASSALADEAMDQEEGMMGEHGEDMSMKGPHFDEMDTDGDGVISSDELSIYGATAAGDSEAERHMNLIDKHDMNKDGQIDRDEFEQAVEKRH
ncbi:EF-hand domain-containing protein [Marinobacter bohaiensis]|uniref:EF-hand domain-containing protein n=2 Tax=Marinobacter TaxID=2742 RepID=UPI0013A69B28|nr:EF-hand domain-containing protein [Marinobacter bohaiensis]